MPVNGDWMVTLSPGARPKLVKEQLPALLQQLEGLHPIQADAEYGAGLPLARQIESVMKSVGVVSLTCLGQLGSGTVHMTMPGAGGTVDEAGQSVPNWVSQWLTEPGRTDVLTKLAKSGAPRQEVFIAVENGAPWSVMSYLSGYITQLPASPPVVPTGITGVWICPTQWHWGVYWDGGAWRVVAVS